VKAENAAIVYEWRGKDGREWALAVADVTEEPPSSDNPWLAILGQNALDKRTKPRQLKNAPVLLWKYPDALGKPSYAAAHIDMPVVIELLEHMVQLAVGRAFKSIAKEVIP
jgi:hypothetical protein